MRHVLIAALLLLGCAPWDAPECQRNADCPATYVCRGGACLRYQLPAGTPYDPLDGGLTDAALD